MLFVSMSLPRSDACQSDHKAKLELRADGRMKVLFGLKNVCRRKKLAIWVPIVFMGNFRLLIRCVWMFVFDFMTNNSG